MLTALNVSPGRPAVARRLPPASARPTLRRGVTAKASAPGAAAKPAQAAAPSDADLLAAAQKLAQLSSAAAPQEEIDAQTELLEQLSAAAGTNRVFAEQNDGEFKGFTLSGRTAQRFSSVITLGTLSFNAYQPADLKVKTQGSDSAGVFKGPAAPRGGSSQAYVIATPFEVVETTGGTAAAAAAGDAAAGDESVTFTGIKGRSLAVGEYRPVPDNPQRLTIQFKRMVLEPVAADQAELQRWLDTLLPHNPTMDPATGILTYDLPAKSPEGWMDYLLMVPQYQLVQGNFGSKTLLERV